MAERHPPTHYYTPDNVVLPPQLRSMTRRDHGIHTLTSHRLATRLHPEQDLGHIGRDIMRGLEQGIEVRVQYNSKEFGNWRVAAHGSRLIGPPDIYRCHPEDVKKLDPLYELFDDSFMYL